MANGCFLSYPGKTPLGGVLAYNGLIPYSYSTIDKVKGDFTVLDKVPFLATNFGKDASLPFKTALNSYSYYKHYVYQTSTGKALWKLQENPKVFTGES